MLKEKIVKHLINNSDNIYSLSMLSNEFDVSRNACHKSINKLINEGYNICLVDKKGYRYCPSDNINKYEIEYYLNKKLNIKVLNSVDSTNNYLKEHVDFDLVVSLEQTKGKGRRGKSFVSSYNKGIFMSYKYRNLVSVEDISYITVCSALAVRNALFKLYDLCLDIKWLNDLYFKNKKLCGILTEASIEAEDRMAKDFIIGIGLNIYEISDEISEIATNLSKLTNKSINRNKIIATVILECEKLFSDAFENNLKSNILEEYISYQFIIGKDVYIEEDGIIELVNVVGIDDDVLLEVKDENGEIKKLCNGMVSLKL